MPRDARANAEPSPAEAWRELYDLVLAEHGSRLSEVTADDGLSPGDVKALLQMSDSEVQPMSALAAAWRCDASTVTWIVDRLERRGLAERMPTPGDRRVRGVSLTAAGRATRSRIRRRLYGTPRRFDALPPGDLRALRRIVERLRDDG